MKWIYDLLDDLWLSIGVHNHNDLLSNGYYDGYVQALKDVKIGVDKEFDAVSERLKARENESNNIKNVIDKQKEVGELLNAQNNVK